MYMMRLRAVLTGCALGSVIAMSAGAAQAITWNLSSPTGNLGSTETYTSSGLSITAAGFQSNSFSSTITLWGKADGPGENGLGTNNDPTGDHELSGNDVIRFDFTSAKAGGASNFGFQMGSTTQGEAWTVYGSNSATSGYVSLLSGTDENSHSFSGANGLFNYYYFKVSSSGYHDNVLIANITATSAVPEPATWAMMLLGFVGLGFLAYRRKDELAQSAA
jgi:hypothetical protein